MFNQNKTVAKATDLDINYSVILSKDPLCERPYGILAVMCNDENDFSVAENIFFTKAEAIECCKWLARNTVCPVTLKDIISNFFVA